MTKIASLLILVAMVSLSACTPTKPKHANVTVAPAQPAAANTSVPPSEWESSFLRSPSCQTTYALVGHDGAAAVPLILATLDRLAGEANAATRCMVIQGALYRPEICTNQDFLPIIERGNKDPSESVRLKTLQMVASRQRMLETRQKERPEATQPARGSGGPASQP
jgi:hypothetical protein